MADPILDLYLLALGSNWTYIWISVIFGYFGWDRFVRRKYRLHICLEEGESLREMKSMSKPLKLTGEIVNWTISKKHGETIGKTYAIDPKDVLFTDRFNKMHIFIPYDNVFSFHPYSDEAGKINFVTIAKAKAQHLFQAVSKGGFLARQEGLRKKLEPDRSAIFLGLLVGVSLGIMLGYNFLPRFLGAPSGFQPIPEVHTTITNTTSALKTIFTGLKP